MSLRRKPVELLAYIALSVSPSASTAAVSVITHVNVAPMDGDRLLTDQNVTILADTIAAIGPSAGAALPRDARIIDGRGHYLMPGLGEMHAHLPTPTDPPEYMLVCRARR